MTRLGRVSALRDYARRLLPTPKPSPPGRRPLPGRQRRSLLLLERILRRFAACVSGLASGPVTSSVSGLLLGSADVRQARSRCLRCCPGATVTALGRPPHRARRGHDLLTRRYLVSRSELSTLVRELAWSPSRPGYSASTPPVIDLDGCHDASRYSMTVRLGLLNSSLSPRRTCPRTRFSART